MANGNATASEPNSHIEKVMEKLECPFTWTMDDITKEDDLEYHSNDDEELFPLLQLMRHVMTVYVDTKSKMKSDEILTGLEKCDDIMTTLKEANHPEISIDAVYYVLQSMQCFVFAELNMKENLKRIISEIKKNWRMNSKERSTLKACRSICWSKYHRIGSSEAELFIRDAIKENPNCELWYFILGKNLRRKRRDSTILTRPDSEEMSSFEKAYNISTNPVFGVFLAQMYREMRRMSDAENIYLKIFSSNPKGTCILLRLALGFIRLKNYTKAKVCLDKVGTISPNHDMYLHYRGVYYFGLKNYKEAAKFFKEASKCNNIPAEKQYLDCAVILDKSFDVVKYMHDMVIKYNYLPEEQTQPLLLDLALAYWMKKRDVSNAIKYFTMAVEIKPEAACITNYYSTLAIRTDEKNMYKLLHRDILPFVCKNKEDLEQSCIDEAEDLKKYCDEYFAKNLTNTTNSFSKINLKT